MGYLEWFWETTSGNTDPTSQSFHFNFAVKLNSAKQVPKLFLWVSLRPAGRQHPASQSRYPMAASDSMELRETSPRPRASNNAPSAKSHHSLLRTSFSYPSLAAEAHWDSISQVFPHPHCPWSTGWPQRRCGPSVGKITTLFLQRLNQAEI